MLNNKYLVVVAWARHFSWLISALFSIPLIAIGLSLIFFSAKYYWEHSDEEPIFLRLRQEMREQIEEQIVNILEEHVSTYHLENREVTKNIETMHTRTKEFLLKFYFVMAAVGVVLSPIYILVLWNAVDFYWCHSFSVNQRLCAFGATIGISIALIVFLRINLGSVAKSVNDRHRWMMPILVMEWIQHHYDGNLTEKMENLQMNHQCCGLFDFEDRLQMNYRIEMAYKNLSEKIKSTFINRNELEMKFRSYKLNASCCQKFYEQQCANLVIADPTKDGDRLEFNIPHYVHKDGCVKLLKRDFVKIYQFSIEILSGVQIGQVVACVVLFLDLFVPQILKRLHSSDLTSSGDC